MRNSCSRLCLNQLFDHQQQLIVDSFTQKYISPNHVTYGEGFELAFVARQFALTRAHDEEGSFKVSPALATPLGWLERARIAR